MTFQFHTLLVGYDGSKPARVAVDLARRIAEGTRARTVLAHVVPSSNLPFGAERYGADVREASGFLAEPARLFTTPVDVDVLDGDPAEALATRANRMLAGALVVGGRGRSSLATLLLGSVARGALQTSMQPILVVHAATPEVRRVLVGVEEDRRSQRVVRVARALADALGVALVLAHTVRLDPHLVENYADYGIPATMWTEGLKAHGERVFAPLRRIAGPGAEERLLFGFAAPALRAAAAEEGADVVVVGRRGKSGLDVDSWISVAWSLAARGPFATLVV